MKLLLRGSSSKATNLRDVGQVRPEPLACGLANRRDSLTNHPHILAVWPGKIRSLANDQPRMADQPDGILLRHELRTGADSMLSPLART